MASKPKAKPTPRIDPHAGRKEELKKEYDAAKDKAQFVRKMHLAGGNDAVLIMQVVGKIGGTSRVPNNKSGAIGTGRK